MSEEPKDSHSKIPKFDFSKIDLPKFNLPEMPDDPYSTKTNEGGEA